MRQALSLATDRDTILRGLWLGRGLIPVGFLPQGDRVGHAPDLPPFAYDLDRARDLLQQAGYAGEPIIQPEEGYGCRSEVHWQPSATGRMELRRDALRWER